MLADVLGVALRADRRLRSCRFQLISAFGMSSSGKSTPATAMAAMPSSRPMKPRCSLVVALRPILRDRMPRAAAMLIFIACGVGHEFGLLRDDGGVHIHDRAVAEFNLARGFVQKDLAGRALPARVGVGEESADVALADGAEDGVANGMHEGVGVGVAVEALRVGNVDAAENQLAALDQGMNIVTDTNVNHEADDKVASSLNQAISTQWHPKAFWSRKVPTPGFREAV